MSELATDVLDELGTQFPQHIGILSAVAQALNDVLGAAFGQTEFVDVFVDSEGDAVLAEVTFVLPPITLAIPGLSTFSLSVGHTDEIELELAITLDSTGAKCSLFETPIFVQCIDSDLLVPVVMNGDKWEPDRDTGGTVKPLTLVFAGVSVEITSDGTVKVTSDLALDLPPVMIGSSGVVVEMKGVTLCMSDDVQLPNGVPAGSRGFVVGSINAFLPYSLKGTFAPNEIIGDGLFLGTGGFTGRLSAAWTNGKSIQLGGIDCTLKSLLFNFKQNSLVESKLDCELQLPFFNQPVNADVALGIDGHLSVALSATQPPGVVADNGLVTFEKPGLLKMLLDSIRFDLGGGLFTAKLAGKITPLAGANAGLKWPTFDVQELSINSKGEVTIKG